ncbi:MAG: hypothetical protein KKF30_04335 [Proteobacteria bacterium]|nr:hypothetical protein [Pseudomonadota bacterium]MBU4471909.1 hypothetical protein [Pseudomonadota bacterium]MCG2752815.1 hypothetical protein [Desulfobacteraceae bacterium]
MADVLKFAPGITVTKGKKKKGGQFILVLPDDLMADRMVKAVCKIEVIHLDLPVE